MVNQRFSLPFKYVLSFSEFVCGEKVCEVKRAEKYLERSVWACLVDSSCAHTLLADFYTDRHSKRVCSRVIETDRY